MEKAEEYHDAAAGSGLPSLTRNSWMKYLEGEEISAEEIKAAIRKGTIANQIVPGLLRYRPTATRACRSCWMRLSTIMPSPLDIRGYQGRQPRDRTRRMRRHACDEAPFSALAFKIATDPFVGKLALLPRLFGHARRRVPRSTTPPRANASASAASCRCTPTTARISTRFMQAISPRRSVLRIPPRATRSATRTHPIILESMEFPEPVIRVAIEPKTKAGQEKMGIALAKLAEEDPTFKTYTDEETGQTIIAGMGELHLEIIVDRLLREFKVEANVGKPQVAYQGDHPPCGQTWISKYARQSGGKGQYGHVKIID